MKINNAEEVKNELDEGEVVDENEPTLFEQKNREKILSIIEKGPQIVLDPEEDEEHIERRTEYCQRKTKELNIDRYSCQICDKLFRAPHYVEKHILNKHDTKVYKKIDQRRFEELLFENYMKDPNKFINQPSNPNFQNIGGFRRGTFNRRGISDRKYDDYRRKGRGDRNPDQQENKREYIDYDDPNQNKKSERQLVNYDDLFQ